MTSGEKKSVWIKQRIEAPPKNVAAFVADFRHAKDWMVGVESVEKTGEDAYRLRLVTPAGRLEPEVLVLERGPERIRWKYTSAINGGGSVKVTPEENGNCVVSYTGEFALKQRLLGRVAKAVGMERFARMNGERSLQRLKHLMEARRY